MNDSLAQHAAQTPSPATGSRQATHSVGSAMSSASLAACDHAPCAKRNAPRKWVEMERDGDAWASMGAKASAGIIDSQAAKHGGTDAWIAPASIPGLISPRRAGESPAGRRAGYGPGNRASR